MTLFFGEGFHGLTDAVFTSADRETLRGQLNGKSVTPFKLRLFAVAGVFDPPKRTVDKRQDPDKVMRAEVVQPGFDRDGGQIPLGAADFSSLVARRWTTALQLDFTRRVSDVD